MNKLFKLSIAWGLSISTTILTLVPDSIISSVKLCETCSENLVLLINRVLILFGVFFLSIVSNCVFLLFRRKITLRGRYYCIQVEYGNIFNYKGCQKVISFDECFTTVIGTAPHEIKESSICGQYLKANQGIDIQELINREGLEPEIEKSRFKNHTRYTSGKIVPNGDDLLMAFAKLDENGRGFFPTREDYLNSLAVMWAEIHKHFQMKDVCIPILGGGLTTIGESTLTQQELVDLIIASYKLSSEKIKSPQKLRIVCKKNSISLNKVGNTI